LQTGIEQLLERKGVLDPDTSSNRNEHCQKTVEGREGVDPKVVLCLSQSWERGRWLTVTASLIDLPSSGRRPKGRGVVVLGGGAAIHAKSQVRRNGHLIQIGASAVYLLKGGERFRRKPGAPHWTTSPPSRKKFCSRVNLPSKKKGKSRDCMSKKASGRPLGRKNLLPEKRKAFQTIYYTREAKELRGKFKEHVSLPLRGKGMDSKKKT